MPELPQKPSPGDFQEIADIQATYAEYDRQGLTQTLWAPFAAEEVAVRTQQVRVFSGFLRTHGRLHLEGLRILDVGCGTGRHLRQMIDMGAAPGDVHGLDIDPITLSRAREVSPNLSITAYDGVTIPFPDDSFDLVTHYYVFSSIPSSALRQRLAGEMRRVTRPDGAIFWWDILHLADPAQHSVALDVHDLFPQAKIRARKIPLQPPPVEALRRCRGLTRLLSPLLARMTYPPCRQAALITW
jgi:SAM-dependent methyltransferase